MAPPGEKDGTGGPTDHSSSHAQTPQTQSRFPQVILPVPTASSGETRGCGRPAAQRRCRGEVAAQSLHGTSTSRFPAQPACCAAGGRWGPAEPPAVSVRRLQTWPRGGRSYHSRFQPVPAGSKQALHPASARGPHTHHFHVSWVYLSPAQTSTTCADQGAAEPTTVTRAR